LARTELFLKWMYCPLKEIVLWYKERDRALMFLAMVFTGNSENQSLKDDYFLVILIGINFISKEL
jgi:hypothetical protein